MNLYTLFGATKHKEADSQLRQGAIVTLFGSTQLDLNDAELAYDQVVLNVINALGETSLKVPADWAIDSTLVTLFGESRGLGHNPQHTTRRLKLQGLCLFGEVRIERGHPPPELAVVEAPAEAEEAEDEEAPAEDEEAPEARN